MRKKTTPAAIAAQPLVPVAGYTAETVVITLYMHRGYDRIIGTTDEIFATLLDCPAGKYSVPTFGWPIHAIVERRAAR